MEQDERMELMELMELQMDALAEVEAHKSIVPETTEEIICSLQEENKLLRMMLDVTLRTLEAVKSGKEAVPVVDAMRGAGWR